MILALVVAGALLAQTAPADPDDDANAPPPPLTGEPATTTTPPPAQPPPTTPTITEPPRAVIGAEADPLQRCHELVARARLEQAAQCFREAHAVAMADVVDAWVAPAPAVTAPVAKADDAGVSFAGLVESGAAEGVLHGSVAGAGAGFLSAAALFSTTRQSEKDTLPWLIASPAIGAVGGAVGSYFLVQTTKPTPGDIALSASAMWAGAGEGFLLQLAVFDQSQDVSTVPLRFLTVLGGGALGLGAGIAASPYLDVTQGDAAVANSALVWGGVLTGIGLGIASTAQVSLTTSQVSFALLGGSLLPYGVALAAHPVLRIERWPSWLIEAGGAGGFLVAGALAVVIAPSTGFDSAIPWAILGAGTAAGVALGGVSAWVVSAAVTSSSSSSSSSPAWSIAPTAFVDDHHRAVPGLALAGRF